MPAAVAAAMGVAHCDGRGDVSCVLQALGRGHLALEKGFVFEVRLRFKSNGHDITSRLRKEFLDFYTY